MRHEQIQTLSSRNYRTEAGCGRIFQEKISGAKLTDQNYNDYWINFALMILSLYGN